MRKQTMKLKQLLETQREQIISDATNVLTDVRLKHYEASAAAQNRERFERLFEFTYECVKCQELVPIVEYTRRIASERFANGFDLQEVQTAMNVLEETIWRHITTSLPAAEYPEAFGLTGTILGAGKQALASEYVSLASQQHNPSLDLSELFKGT